MPVTATDFESAASTNSTTLAYLCDDDDDWRWRRDSNSHISALQADPIANSGHVTKPITSIFIQLPPVQAASN